MIAIMGISIAIRILAIVWSVVLLCRMRDWRISFLTLMFALMALRQLLTLWNTPTSSLTDFTLITSEFPGLIVSIIAFLLIFYLKQILTAPLIAKRDLKESEERFHQLAENLEEIFWITSIDGEKIIYISPAYESIFHRKTAELHNDPKSWITYIVPEDQPKVIDAFKQENLVRGLFNVKYRVKRPNGSIRWIKAKGFPVKNKLGETYRIAGIATDITEENILKLSFQKSQTLFQILAKVSPVGIFHTDEKGFCTFVNDRWCEISSLTLEEAQGSGWRGALHPEDRDQVFSKWNDFAREGKTFQMEYRFLNTSGKSSWVFGQAEAEKDLENNIIGYVGTITDITQLKLTEFALKNSQVELEQRVKDRTSDLVKINDALKRDVIHRKETEALLRKAQEEAEKANSAKSEFLSHMSHELRTPLNAILGFAQLLVLNKRNNLDLKEQESVGQIRIAGNHLLELINEVLELTQIEGGSLKVHNENTDISRLLKKLLPVVEPMANKRKIIINNHISETSDSYVFADPTRLKQSLINLIVNAIKYNYEGGEISIKSKITDENRIKIHIIDTGPGIDAEKQKLLFEPFERLGAEDSGIEGTGIGLTITKKLMNLMDGSISLKSERGKGSQFTIELPAGNRSEQTTEKHPLGKIVQRKTREENRNAQTILYIEDNNSNLKLIQKYLEEFTSFKFLSSQSAVDGLALARQHQPSLILMDINLPEMDGITAFKELQSWDETKSIPVIEVSANAMKHTVKSALDTGFKDYITKPVDLNLLVETIQKYLNSLTS